MLEVPILFLCFLREGLFDQSVNSTDIMLTSFLHNQITEVTLNVGEERPLLQNESPQISDTSISDTLSDSMSEMERMTHQHSCSI